MNGWVPAASVNASTPVMSTTIGPAARVVTFAPIVYGPVRSPTAPTTGPSMVGPGATRVVVTGPFAMASSTMPATTWYIPAPW